MAAKVALSKNSKKLRVSFACHPYPSTVEGEVTLPKTNSQFAPDNGPGPKSKGSSLPTIHFQVVFAVCFRGVSISYSLWHSGSETSIAPSLSNLWNGKCYQTCWNIDVALIIYPIDRKNCCFLPWFAPCCCWLILSHIKQPCFTHCGEMHVEFLTPTAPNPTHPNHTQLVYLGFQET